MWSQPMATRFFLKKQLDAKRGALKRGKYTSAMDRWQNDEVCRESEWVHGWTNEWVKYLDYISKIAISHDAPYRQRQRYESTVCMRSVHSNKQAGPLCQRPMILLYVISVLPLVIRFNLVAANEIESWVHVVLKI